MNATFNPQMRQLIDLAQSPFSRRSAGAMGRGEDRGQRTADTNAVWLMIYHGVSGRIIEPTDHQPFVRSCAGIMILDAEEPRKVMFRSLNPIPATEIEEERSSAAPNVVFPTAVDPREDGTFDVYHGIADAAIGVARASGYADVLPAYCCGETVVEIRSAQRGAARCTRPILQTL
jgi:hypothetical protein